MHYLFLDESYPPVRSRRDIVMAAWAVKQERFDHYEPRCQELYRTPVLASINSMFESIDAWAVVAKASLDSLLFRTAERDSTDDIADMARSDNIWSQCVVFLVGWLIKELMLRNNEVGTVDIYYDPKSLKADHAAALGKTLRELVVPLAKQYDSERGLQMLRTLEIRHIKAVEKARGSQAPDKFQMATWVADKLCSFSRDVIQTEGFSRIIITDMSDLIKGTVQQFDGKSFYED